MAMSLAVLVCGLILAVVLWLGNRDHWVLWMRRYLALNLAGLSIYVIYPMVPPWMRWCNPIAA